MRIGHECEGNLRDEELTDSPLRGEWKGVSDTLGAEGIGESVAINDLVGK